MREKWPASCCYYCPEASDCNLAILRFVLKCPCDVGFAFAVMSFTRFFATQLKNRSTSSLFKSWPATQTLESMGTWPNVSMQHALSMTLQNNALWVVAVKNFFSKSGDDYFLEHSPTMQSQQECEIRRLVKSSIHSTQKSRHGVFKLVDSIKWFQCVWRDEIFPAVVTLSCSDDWSSKVATDIEYYEGIIRRRKGIKRECICQRISQTVICWRMVFSSADWIALSISVNEIPENFNNDTALILLSVSSTCCIDTW